VSGREAGFTLVEVIVALAILAASLSVLLAMISSGLLRTSSAERLIEAGSLTQSLLAELGTDYPISAGERAGEFAAEYHWHLKMQPVADGSPEGLIGLYEVSANVEWEEGSKKHSFRLNTLRVGPKASQR
jgi:general secretion pathway protein I